MTTVIYIQLIRTRESSMSGPWRRRRNRLAGRPRHLCQRLSQPAVAFADRCGLRFPALSWLPGQRRAQDAICPAVGNGDMSSPVSARIASADRRPTPGMLSRRSSAARKGQSVTATIRMSSLSIWRDSSSIRSGCRLSTNRWWSRIRPGTTAASSLRFPRRLPRARSARTFGFSSPSIMASRILRPVTPMMSDTTEASLTFASSGSCPPG